MAILLNVTTNPPPVAFASGNATITALRTQPFKFTLALPWASTAIPAFFLGIMSTADNDSCGFYFTDTGGGTCAIGVGFNGTQTQTVPVTFSSGQTLSFLLNPLSNTFTLSGFTTGNGTYSFGTALGNWWPTGNGLKVGGFFTPGYDITGATWSNFETIEARSLLSAQSTGAGGYLTSGFTPPTPGTNAFTRGGWARVNNIIDFFKTLYTFTQGAGYTNFRNTDPGAPPVELQFATNGGGEILLDIVPGQWFYIAISVPTGPTAATPCTVYWRTNAETTLHSVASVLGTDTGTRREEIGGSLAGGNGNDQWALWRGWSAALTGTELLAESNSESVVRTANLFYNIPCNVLNGNDTSGNSNNFSMTGTLSQSEAYPTFANPGSSVALAGSAGLAATGQAIKSSSVALAGAGAVAATGQARSNAAAAETGSAALAATGQARVSSAAAETGSAALTATGGARANAAAAETGAAALNVTGGARADGAVALTGAGAVSAVGGARTDGSAALTGTAALAASPNGTVDSTAALGGTGSLAAVGSASASAAAAMTGAAALLASGVAARNAATAIAAGANVAATGQARSNAASALTGAAALTSTGQGRINGATALGASCSVAATGGARADGAVALTGAMNLASAGQARVNCSSSLTGAAVFEASSSGTVNSTSSLTGSAALAAVGGARASAAAALTGSMALQAAPSSASDANAAFAGAAALVAAGQARVSASVALGGAAGLLAVPRFDGAVQLTGGVVLQAQVVKIVNAGVSLGGGMYMQVSLDIDGGDKPVLLSAAGELELASLYLSRIRNDFEGSAVTPWTSDPRQLVNRGIIYQGSYTLERLLALNADSATRYLLVFDNGRLPEPGDIPNVSLAIGPNGFLDYTASGDGTIFEHGCSYGFSTSTVTYQPANPLLWLTAFGHTP